MKKTTIPLTFLMLFITGNMAHAIFVLPTFLPVDRLVSNTEAYMKEHPSDPQAHYTLARIHYLAFVNKANTVGTTYTKDGELPRVAPDWLLGKNSIRLRNEHARQTILNTFGYKSLEDIPRTTAKAFWEAVQRKQNQLKEENWQPKQITAKAALKHASKAIKHFKTAIKLDPENGLFYLGLASLYDQYLDIVKDLDSSKRLPELMTLTNDRVAKIYFEAYRLSIDADLQQKYMPTPGLTSMVGHEAGSAYVHFMRKKETLTKKEETSVKKVEKRLSQLKKLPQGPITPIIFSFENHSGVDDLLSQNIHVSFDLDGDGVSELWPWVQPHTALLVWDPDHKGEITSGRQLFGSATWWIFFRDGYAALDALDNNRDKMLKSEELDGIAAWFDSNSNGKSDQGEVIPIRELDVIGISTQATHSADGILTNPKGMELLNGKTTATYDWVTSPVKVPSSTLN